jgi:stearoyl-CoA desaturase (delta-9 desaturase)
VTTSTVSDPIATDPDASRIEKPRGGGRGVRLGAPFVLVHLSCLLVLAVGWSPTALYVALGSYLLRMFGITAFYHRCFSHRAFRTSRVVGFIGGFLGAAAAQNGPLWWAAHHRMHHRRTDQPGDPHSPRIVGLLRSHTGWQFEAANLSPDRSLVDDLSSRWELRALDVAPYAAPALWIALCFGFGIGIDRIDPALGTSGWQCAVWGFAISTVALWHATFLVNSVAHRFGRRRFPLDDDSRNNWLVALLTLGEGWHNNHHRFPNGARQGLARLEIDPTYLLLRVFACLGIVRDLRPTPSAVMDAARRSVR